MFPFISIVYSATLFAAKPYMGLIAKSTMTHIEKIKTAIPRNKIAKYDFDYISSILKI